MLRKLRKRIKGQSTAEYAILIALVVAAVIAMQTFAKRTLQARIRDASQYLVEGTSNLGNTAQYEPYYLDSQFEVTRDSSSTMEHGNMTVGSESSSNISRATGGYQQYEEGTTIGNGLEF